MFPLMARYQNSLPQHATNSLNLAVVKLPRTVDLLVLCALPAVIAVISIQPFLQPLIFWLAVGFGFVSYMSSILLKPVFAELENGNVQLMK